jgi:hypothetical protein
MLKDQKYAILGQEPLCTKKCLEEILEPDPNDIDYGDLEEAYSYTIGGIKFVFNDEIKTILRPESKATSLEENIKSIITEINKELKDYKITLKVLSID